MKELAQKKQKIANFIYDEQCNKEFMYFSFITQIQCIFQTFTLQPVAGDNLKVKKAFNISDKHALFVASIWGMTVT